MLDRNFVGLIISAFNEVLPFLLVTASHALMLR
jgi:hypothetical protein